MHILFYICLFFAIWFTSVNMTRAFYRQNVSKMNFVIMAAAIVGCVFAASHCSC